MSSEDSTDQALRLFEFDELKSRINKRQHGIDFVEAQALWLDLSLASVPARSDVEARLLVVDGSPASTGRRPSPTVVTSSA